VRDPSGASVSLSSSCLRGCLLVVSALVLALSGYALWIRYSPTPFADSWDPIESFQLTGHRLNWGALAWFHQEHRPATARALILADVVWAGARGYLTHAAILAIQAAQVCLLWFIARRQPWFEKRHRALAAAFAVFCCFSPGQIENLGWPFQTAFLLAFLLPVAALSAVVRQKETGSWVWSVAVFFCASLAPLCLISGVLVWWWVAAMAVALRLSWRWIAAYSSCAAATVYLYFLDYPSAVVQSRPFDAVRKPSAVLWYVAEYFGSSWQVLDRGQRWKNWTLGAGEILAVGAVVAVCVWIWRRRAGTNPWEAVPPAIALLCLANGFATAIGRLSVGLGNQPYASRYQTPALLFWFVAVLVVLGIGRNRRWVLPAVSAVVLAGMLVPLESASVLLRDCAHIQRIMDRGGQAWIAGVEDLDAMLPITYYNYLKLRQGYFDRRLGWFATPPGSEIGTRIDASRIEVAGVCEGGFLREAFFPSAQWPGLRFHGGARRAGPGGGAI
jgi:hypothetical protein